MTLTGESMLAGRRGAGQGVAQYAVDPATGEQLEPGYLPSTRAEVEEAVAAAHEAFAVYGWLSGREKGAFLREIAARIEALGTVLTERAVRESGLPVGRIQMETGRTCHQLRMFAALVEEGSWVDARLDQPDPQRTPAPKPDVRSMKRPLGPVVVFGASNFPLAFSVAGGDTASALAAGCPVVVKAHPAHPGTSELVGVAIQEAARATGMPAGVFSLVYDSPSHEVGAWLVEHPLIRAGGFTGSRRAGLALLAIAQRRTDPIPFYAEMSSVNPVFLLPGALRERAEALATGLQASVTLGAGQFCTKPGLVILADPAAAAPLVERLQALLAQTPPQTMLTASCFGTSKHGSPPNTSLLTGMVHEACPRQRALTTFCELGALHDWLTDSDGHEPIGAPYEAKEMPLMPTSLGVATLRGEIVDSKCYLGAMKPGDQKTHKACATLCIRGGIPPVLVERLPGGGTRCTPSRGALAACHSALSKKGSPRRAAASIGSASSPQ